MGTKKILLVIGGVLAGLALVVAVMVGAIAGAVFYTIGHSEAAATAKNFLRRSERLKRDIGEVHDFGSFPTGSIDVNNAEGAATVNLKVVGARRTTDATVSLISRDGAAWRVSGANYRDEANRTVELLDTYGAQESPVVSTGDETSGETRGHDVDAEKPTAERETSETNEEEGDTASHGDDRKQSDDRNQ